MEELAGHSGLSINVLVLQRLRTNTSFRSTAGSQPLHQECTPFTLIVAWRTDGYFRKRFGQAQTLSTTTKNQPYLPFKRCPKTGPASACPSRRVSPGEKFKVLTKRVCILSIKQKPSPATTVCPNPSFASSGVLWNASAAIFDGRHFNCGPKQGIEDS